MSLFTKIYSKCPVRRTKKQKQEFFNLVKNNITNRSVQIERLKDKHDNIIVGDIKKANVIFTAHYDTPKRSLFPNLMIPRNPLLSALYHYGIFIVFAFLSIALAYLISLPFNKNNIVLVACYLVIYFSLFYVCTRLTVNKHNANDNSSGCVCLFEIARKTVSKKVAFVFFDNEEKGLLGSNAFNKKHREILKDKLVINLDCVGVGNNFIFILMPNAEKHDLIKKLKSACLNSADYRFKFFPFKGSVSNSDYKNFACGIGVGAYTKSKKGIYYMGKIHTKNDRFINEKNIITLSEKLLKFVDLMQDF